MMQRLLPRKLRLLRAERGLTLSEAAEQIGVTRDTLSDLERGRRHPHAPTLAKIAAGYSVALQGLLDAEEEESGASLGVDVRPKAPAPSDEERPDLRRLNAQFCSALLNAHADLY